MGIPRFIKLPGHKKFEYSPRYWDPEKEEREDRIRRIKQEMGIELKVIATGGLARVMQAVSKTIEEIEPNLTLEGLRILGEQV